MKNRLMASDFVRVAVAAAMLVALVVYATPRKWRPRLFVVGDSIAVDTYSSVGWTTVVGADLGVVVHNLSAPGSSAVDWADHLEFLRFFVAGYPAGLRAIVVVLGTNDYAPRSATPSSVAEFATAYRKLMRVFPADKTVCVTPLYRYAEHAENAVGQTLEQYRAVVREYCSGVVVKGPDAVPRGKASFSDSVHLADAGSAALADAIIAAVRSLDN